MPVYSPYAVAEHAMAIIQEANRRLHKAYYKVKDNNFALSGLLGLDLHNKVAGIIGTGKIGVCMAQICKGYGMTVLGWDTYPNEDEDENVYTDRSDEIIADDITARLLMFPQVVMTSHQAFFTREAMQAIAVVTMENARNFNEGNDYEGTEVKA